MAGLNELRRQRQRELIIVFLKPIDTVNTVSYLRKSYIKSKFFFNQTLHVFGVALVYDINFFRFSINSEKFTYKSMSI